MKINNVENIIIKVGVDPSDSNSIQELIKSKENDIQVLRKKLNMPTLEHVKTLESEEMQKEEEKILSLIIELSKLLEKMEVQNECLLKGKVEHKCTVTNPKASLTEGDPSKKLVDTMP